MTTQEKAEMRTLVQKVDRLADCVGGVRAEVHTLTRAFGEFKKAEERQHCKHKWAFTAIGQYANGDTHKVTRRCRKCGLEQADLFGSPRQSFRRLRKFRKRQSWKFDHKKQGD